MINIKINGTEYTLEEAQELYNELRQIFEEPETHISGSDIISKSIGKDELVKMANARILKNSKHHRKYNKLANTEYEKAKRMAEKTQIGSDDMVPELIPWKDPFNKLFGRQ